jgi:hypothetical protein
MTETTYACIICGHKTLDSRCDWDICPVCFWEDDVLFTGEDKTSSANAMSVSDAQANYARVKAISKELLKNVREPLPGEEREEGWKPMAKVEELLKLDG